jgi:hypothetical protein
VSMIQKSILSMAVLTVAAMIIPVGGKAETPGRHPRYLHARTDLRVAQWLSRVHEEPNVMRNLNRCDQEIEAAIHEIVTKSTWPRSSITRIWKTIRASIRISIGTAASEK